jgi:copper chaperone
METLKFKTTIKCSGCINKATPFLNNKLGEDNWEVDVQNPDKILTVMADKPVTKDEVIQTVEEAGFKAEFIEG